MSERDSTPTAVSEDGSSGPVAHAEEHEVADRHWSIDEEHFNYDTLGELLDCNDHLQVGDTVYHGRAETPDPGAWVDEDDIIENLACRAGDEAGEYADDYPSVSKEARAELQSLLETWARKHCTPTFFLIKDVQHYEITAEDLSHD